MPQNECLSCRGTGRGTFGGPCNNCAGRGQVGTAVGVAQIIVVLLVVVIVAWAILGH